MSARTTAIARVLRANRAVARAQAELLEALGCLDAFEDWEEEGAHDAAHWVSMALQVSNWRASRWIETGKALASLPSIAEAFARGELSLYAVMELCRYVSPDEEEAACEWAKDSSMAQIARAADRECARVEDTRAAAADRYLEYRYTDGGSRFAFRGELPGAEGAMVAAQLDGIAEEIPVLPDEEPHPAVGRDAALATRRADALVALCTHGGGHGLAASGAETEGTMAEDEEAEGSGAERAGAQVSHGAGRSSVPMMNVHVSLEHLTDLEDAARMGGAGYVEGGPPLCRETTERLLCNAQVRPLLEDRNGNVIGVGRSSRNPTRAMLRQLRHRDQNCIFPGCSHRRFTEAHHVIWWSKGGRTDLDNLALVCAFHHRLVHEHGWRLEHEGDGGFAWYKPDGVRYRAGPVAA